MTGAQEGAAASPTGVDIMHPGTPQLASSGLFVVPWSRQSWGREVQMMAMPS